LELLIVVLAFIILSEGVCLAFGYIFLPLLVGAHGIWQLAMLSSVTYFIRWLLYSLILIAIYAYYRKCLGNSIFIVKTAFL
jgi:hypothetical protein